MLDYTPQIRIGEDIKATVRVATPNGVPLGGLELDLEGDGFAGCRVWGAGLEAVDTLRCRANKAGTYNLWVKAITIEGCPAQTGRRRNVEVIQPVDFLNRCAAFLRGDVPPAGMTPSPETTALCTAALAALPTTVH